MAEANREKSRTLQIDRTHMCTRKEAEQQWFVIDAEGKVLGRLASEIAQILRGKHRPDFTPHADSGDGVIVINADKVKVTGRKEATKVYRTHSGRPGSMREVPYRRMMERHPERIIEHAVKGMVPRTKLGRKQMSRLRCIAGTEHNMQAQKPIKVNI